MGETERHSWIPPLPLQRMTKVQCALPVKTKCPPVLQTNGSGMRCTVCTKSQLAVRVKLQLLLGKGRVIFPCFHLEQMRYSAPLRAKFSPYTGHSSVETKLVLSAYFDLTAYILLLHMAAAPLEFVVCSPELFKC